MVQQKPTLPLVHISWEGGGTAPTTTMEPPLGWDTTAVCQPDSNSLAEREGAAGGRCSILSLQEAKIVSSWMGVWLAKLVLGFQWDLGRLAAQLPLSTDSRGGAQQQPAVLGLPPAPAQPAPACPRKTPASSVHAIWQPPRLPWPMFAHRPVLHGGCRRVWVLQLPVKR